MFNRILLKNQCFYFILLLLFILSDFNIHLVYSSNQLKTNTDNSLVDCSTLKSDQCSKQSHCLNLEAKSCCSGKLYYECQTLPLSLVRCKPDPDLNLWCLEDDSTPYDLWSFNISSCHRPANSFIPLSATCKESTCPNGFECVDSRPKPTCGNKNTKTSQCCNYRAKCVIAGSLDASEESGSTETTSTPTPTPTQNGLLLLKNYPYNIIVPSCAAIKCSAGFECIDDPKKGSHCVPTCKTMTCASNQTCVICNEKPKCITTCDNMTCPKGYHCVDDKSNGGSCVQDPISTLNTTTEPTINKTLAPIGACNLDCEINLHCIIDDITKKPRCVPLNFTTCKTKHCPSGEVCFDDAEKGAYCFKSANPCFNKNCPVGTICNVANDTGKAYCKPTRNCTNFQCSKGYACFDDKDIGVICKKQLVNCTELDCKNETKCIEDNVLGGRCVSIYTSCTLLNCTKDKDCIVDKSTQLAKCIPIKRVEPDSSTESNATISTKPPLVITCKTMNCSTGFKCVDNSVSGAQCVTVITCDHLKCPKGSKCVNNSTLYEGIPYCVPLPTCSNTKCPGDCYCQDTDDDTGPQCIPKATCELLDCRPEYRCVEDKERGARCIQRSIVTCSSIRCLEGYTCVDDSINGGSCQKIDPKTQFKPWTPNAAGWASTAKTTTSSTSTQSTKPTPTPTPTEPQLSIEAQCQQLDCPFDTFCMADKERGGVMCASKHSCSAAHCKFGEECFTDENGSGSCRKITCGTLQCKLPKVCHSTPSGIPECK